MRTTLLFALLGSPLAWASPISIPKALRRRGASHTVTPQVASVTVLGNLTDPLVSRDSCISTRIGSRVLWTCRDTMAYNYEEDKSTIPIVSNTASWTNFAEGGEPAFQAGPLGAGSNGANSILLMQGGKAALDPPFFPVPENACHPSGFCEGSSRWAIWPDTAPLVTDVSEKGMTTAYTYIPKVHLDGLTPLNWPPPASLYRMEYNSSEAQGDELPKVEMVHEYFWGPSDINYGVYGSMVSNGTAYLYGGTETEPKGVALAKAPVHQLHDRSQYEYFVNGMWTSTMPDSTDPAANVPNAGTTGQGGFYYSGYFKSFVWIGESAIGGSADFFISTAKAPEGPWTEAKLFYQGHTGNSNIVGAYSCVPNPSLLTSEDQNGIYLTYTQAYEEDTYGAYVTPLVYIEWR